MKHSNNNLKQFVLWISLIFLFACTTENPAELDYFEKSEVQAAIHAADKRELNTLLPFLKHPDPEVRWAAAHGAISIKDSSIIAPLANALLDSLPHIRRECYLALGSSEHPRAGEIIFELLPKEQNQDCRKAAWYALGKTCSAADYQNVFQMAQSEKEEHAPAWFLYWTGVRGIGGGNAVQTAVKWLKGKAEENRLGAAHFLSRTPNLSLDAQDEALKEAFFKERNPEVKIALALAFRNNNLLSKEEVLEMIVEARDERVVQNLFRAAWTRGLLSAADLLPWLGESHHPLTRTMAASWMVDQPWDIHLFELMSAQLKSYDEELQSILLKGILANSKNKAPWVDDIRQRFSLTNTPDHIKANYISALYWDTSSIPFLSTLLDQSQGKLISTVALETLIDMKSSLHWDENIDFNTIIDLALESKDLAQIYLISKHLSNPEQQYKLTFQGLDKLKIISSQLSVPREMEAFIAIEECIAYLEDRPFVTPKPQFNHPIDFEPLLKLKSNDRIKVVTNKGAFFLQLNPKGAPGSTSNFIQEMEGGRFDGRTFHRVVPNFVAQGACPRGDGFGGPDYSLRTEACAMPFRTGTIGLASAGRDTEGVQWFITHSPTPHLEGNYTAFGEVTDGMDVVRSLQEGDQIIQVQTINFEHE